MGKPVSITYEHDGTVTLEHFHPLPDVGAEPGTYAYTDGCAVIVHADGSSEFVPAPSDDAKPELLT